MASTGQTASRSSLYSSAPDLASTGYRSDVVLPPIGTARAAPEANVEAPVLPVFERPLSVPLDQEQVEQVNPPPEPARVPVVPPPAPGSNYNSSPLIAGKLPSDFSLSNANSQQSFVDSLPKFNNPKFNDFANRSLDESTRARLPP